MSIVERFQKHYEYERDCNLKMLAMIESVPASNRPDARFQQAVNLAGHLAACRENWLDRMQSDGLQQTAWFEEMCDWTTLRSRYEVIEGRWADYLASLTDNQLAEDFEFPVGGGSKYRVPTEVQLMQLVGHACYHRGQIALLVDQLGGETVDTDYLFWAVRPPK